MRETSERVVHYPMNWIRKVGWLGVYEVFSMDEDSARNRRLTGGGVFGTIHHVCGRKRAEALAGSYGVPWFEM
jgi:hypothetical protein